LKGVRSLFSAFEAHAPAVPEDVTIAQGNETEDFEVGFVDSVDPPDQASQDWDLMYSKVSLKWGDGKFTTQWLGDCAEDTTLRKLIKKHLKPEEMEVEKLAQPAGFELAELYDSSKASCLNILSQLMLPKLHLNARHARNTGQMCFAMPELVFKLGVHDRAPGDAHRWYARRVCEERHRTSRPAWRTINSITQKVRSRFYYSFDSVLALKKAFELRSISVLVGLPDSQGHQQLAAALPQGVTIGIVHSDQIEMMEPIDHAVQPFNPARVDDVITGGLEIGEHGILIGTRCTRACLLVDCCACRHLTMSRYEVLLLTEYHGWAFWVPAEAVQVASPVKISYKRRHFKSKGAVHSRSAEKGNVSFTQTVLRQDVLLAAITVAETFDSR
jgi:hypothetical protein